jgi:putative DNA methylase
MRIDQQFDATFADALATLEAYNKHLYRPNSYLHKWWARRCGSTFRAILKHLVTDETRQDYYTAGGLENTIILDPMMGGGTTLHEALRLGANVVGADIDPIPILQARATLSAVSLPELTAAFQQFHNSLHDGLAQLYQTTCPRCAQAQEWQYMLYGLQRHCACRQVLVVDSFVLRHHNDDSIIRIDPTTHAIFQDDQLISATDDLAYRLPLVERGNQTCERCLRPYQDKLHLPYFQRYVPIAVAGECKVHGLFFNSISQREQEAITCANQQRANLNFSPADFGILPGPKSKSLLARKVESYLDVYSSRQLLVMDRAISILPQFEPLIRLNLALLLSTSLEFNSLLCGYKGTQKRRPGAVRHTFSHHAYSFPSTAVENNPLHPQKASGNLQNLFYSRIVRGRQWAARPEERRIVNGKAERVIITGELDAGTEVTDFNELAAGSRRFMLLQGSSARLNLPDNSVDFVVTDPPYFDSVQYSDLAAYFRVWLQQLLPADVNWHYALDEAAVDQQANGNGQFDRVLSDIFAECHRVLKQNGRLIFTFHHRNPKGWAALTKALQTAGFVLVNRYAIHAENPISVHIVNQDTLLHDVILVLAPAESGCHTQWNLPNRVEMNDSQRFSQDCATMMGWLLNQNLPDMAIDAHWIKLLTTW